MLLKAPYSGLFLGLYSSPQTPAPPPASINQQKSYIPPEYNRQLSPLFTASGEKAGFSLPEETEASLDRPRVWKETKTKAEGTSSRGGGVLTCIPLVFPFVTSQRTDWQNACFSTCFTKSGASKWSSDEQLSFVESQFTSRTETVGKIIFHTGVFSKL